MAEQIEPTEDIIQDLFHTSPRMKYPWEEWTNGDVWKLYQGEDYQKRSSMRTYCYQQAAARDMDVHTRCRNEPIDHDEVGGEEHEVMFIQFTERDEDEIEGSTHLDDVLDEDEDEFEEFELELEEEDVT
tara:strand:+ start:19361 stop:19747 length:387 start_codon:yes stop_codon:yes gene_type:complete